MKLPPSAVSTRDVLLLMLTVHCLLNASWAAAIDVALQQPYTMAPEPNYAHCTDSVYVAQLIDGEHTSVWIKLDMVGRQSNDNTTIIVDIGQIYSLKPIVFNVTDLIDDGLMIGGAAGLARQIIIEVQRQLLLQAPPHYHV